MAPSFCAQPVPQPVSQDLRLGPWGPAGRPATRRLVEDCDRDSAECWVINTCTVKSPSQSAMDNLIAKGQAAAKALVVAGCVPQGDRRAKQLQGLSVIGAPAGPAGFRVYVFDSLCGLGLNPKTGSTARVLTVRAAGRWACEQFSSGFRASLNRVQGG